MPHHSVSLDLKAHIPVLQYSAGYLVKEICGILGIRKSLVYQTLHYHTIHGLCYNPNTCKCGQHRNLVSVDINFIKSLILEHPTIYVNKIQEQLLTWQGTQIINFHTDAYLMLLSPLKQGHFWPCTRAKYWAVCYFYESDGGFGGESKHVDVWWQGCEEQVHFCMKAGLVIVRD